MEENSAELSRSMRQYAYCHLCLRIIDDLEYFISGPHYDTGSALVLWQCLASFKV